ncbi:MAG: cell division protein ZapA [Deltaproteobacteria bacterium]|nr:cell division protein ZapA [Deltaproteobacteria bacterium]MBW2019671.1 cell division protein ZapA [Deltaproteobacteria bacterium]MBW2074451.1 cell division protein ZapA [Deltaproteobacteria bacterium]RLB81669.1 MAG: hypothetical protein DRH17_08315 [Deltaproteobacteria bacterium]
MPQETVKQGGIFVEQLISIELFGHAYTFRASAQVSQPEEVANYVTGQIEKAWAAAEAPSKLDTVILAALNIANDYFEMRHSREGLVKDIDQRCKILIEYIDSNA